MILISLILGWWEYDENKFQEIFDNSWNIPIYAICYSIHCPHCVGIPSRFQMFSQSMANNDDIIYTAINTGNSTGCQKLGARFVPYFVFARGTKKKYWLHPQFNCPLRWLEFVTDWGSPKVIKIDNNSKEINDHIKKTLNGGSTFYLQAPKDGLLFNIFTNLSTKYHIYNDTFVFSESEETAKLTVFTSTECSQTFEVDNQSIIKIIKEYRFSSLHHLDTQEWTKMTKSKLHSVILMNDGELNGTRLQLLNEIANKHCKDSHFGWANLKDEKSISAKLQQKEGKPYIAFINRNNDCQFIQTIESDENSDFIDQFITDSLSIKKEKCTHYVGAEKPKDKKKKTEKNEYQIQNESEKLSINSVFLIVIIIVVISLISIVSYLSNPNHHNSDVEAKIE